MSYKQMLCVMTINHNSTAWQRIEGSPHQSHSAFWQNRHLLNMKWPLQCSIGNCWFLNIIDECSNLEFPFVYPDVLTMLFSLFWGVSIHTAHIRAYHSWLTKIFLAEKGVAKSLTTNYNPQTLQKYNINHGEIWDTTVLIRTPFPVAMSIRFGNWLRKYNYTQ